MIEFISIAKAAEEAAPTGIATLGLNAKLFIGQLVNFAILLFIFWKWILPNVTKKLQERSARIEKAMRDAAITEKEKQEFATWKQAELSKTRAEAAAIVTAAQSEAGKAGQQILEKTKQDQQKLVDQAKAQIESEKQKALADAKSELADLVTNATEKVLRKKLDVKADSELIKKSVSQIH